MKIIITAIVYLISTLAYAQIITSTPPFPSQSEEVTVYYDASEGNAELANTTAIYMHTGVITSNSASPTDWQNVVGNWGTADAQVLMSNEGGGIHSYIFTPSLEDWYSTDMGESIERLAFVFRNAAGNMVGRAEDGGDIFYDLSDGSFEVIFQEPSALSVLAEINESISVSASSSLISDLVITMNGEEVASESLTQSISTSVSASEAGEYEVVVSATLDGTTVTDTFLVVVTPEPTLAEAPAGVINGINYRPDGTVILQLHAPYKDNVFVLGDFNDWSPSLDYMMNLTPDQTKWWITLEGLDADTEYRFQYSVDNDLMRIADPYTEKVVNQWDDPWIPASTDDNITPYPLFLTTDPVSVLQINQPEFNWTDSDYELPAKERLNIYELLVRDFVEARNFQTIIDTLDYLENLGVNAVEFMPINEFEGNLSWGYNPSFFFAVDKFYGGEENYKALINACHERGIAVIMDIALNHSFGQNPQVRLYFDAEAGEFGQPTAQSPWFNEVPKHDFNVGYDYNHESPQTREYCERILQYWVEEYHVDGYRMDLSKGFTQNNTIGNVGAWGQYDQNRIDILNNYKAKVQEVNPDAYFILEHFANNDEETSLANSGSLLWGNLHNEYTEGAMGYSSNLSWGSYQERNWANPHLVTYAESHDEERLMYKALLFGNSAGDYDITEMETALDRMELANVFLYSIPGPKMAWQFGELGYDYSINYCTDGTISEDCRTGDKPIRWDYLEEQGRADIYDVTSLLLYMRNNYDFMHTADFNIDLGGTGKRIHLNGAINATIIGNFDVNEIAMVPGFQNTGTWYEVFTGDEIQEDNLGNSFVLQPGEFRFYVDTELSLPSAITELAKDEKLTIGLYPNPTSSNLFIATPSAMKNQVKEVTVLNMLGEAIYTASLASGNSTYEIDLTGKITASGAYIVKVTSENTVMSSTFLFEN